MGNQAHFALWLLLLAADITGAGESWGEPWAPIAGKPQYFAVSVSDLEVSVAWYVTAFGLRKLDDQAAEDGAWRIVNLASADLLVELIHDKRDQVVQKARGFAKVGYGVADVEVVADRIEGATGSRPRIVEIRQHEVRVIQLRDPDGNLIQLSSPTAKKAQ